MNRLSPIRIPGRRTPIHVAAFPSRIRSLCDFAYANEHTGIRSIHIDMDVHLAADAPDFFRGIQSSAALPSFIAVPLRIRFDVGCSSKM